MNRPITQLVCNLSEVILLIADQLFCMFDLHGIEGFQYSAVVVSAKQPLQLGRADQMLLADALDGHRLGKMIFKVGEDILIKLVIRLYDLLLVVFCSSPEYLR